jgi:hypothetical protein
MSVQSITGPAWQARPRDVTLRDLAVHHGRGGTSTLATQRGIQTL